jgi:hypothetical protein
MPSIKLYRFAIHIRTRTLTGIAPIPNRMFGPPGIEKEDNVKPRPITMIRDETA